MNKGVIIGIIIAVIAIGVGIGFSISNPDVSEPQEIDSETEREPAHYSVKLEESIGVKVP